MNNMKPPDLPLKAKLFRGLADPSRLAVLEALRSGPRCVSEVVSVTGLSQSNASTHLACLEDCGLVTRNRRGKFVYYAIADERVVRVLEEAEAILSDIGANVFRCTRYEARHPRGGRPPDAALEGEVLAHDSTHR
jgi:ArsR family transcriptional regulator, cadmium/lead-responsive transcriptional repressor